MGRRDRQAHALDGFESLAGLQRKLQEQARRRHEAERLAAAQRRRTEHGTELFLAEIADAVPLRPTGRVEPRRSKPRPVPVQRLLDDEAVLVESLSDEIDVEQFLDIDETLSWRRTGIGGDVVRRLRRGEWTVRAQLDLHGLRVHEAREALVVFLAQTVRDEIRCVRIIHGKGLGSVNREPVLKVKVPRWLSQRDEVLAFCDARPNDGGSGAMVVLLRVKRKHRSG